MEVQTEEQVQLAQGQEEERGSILAKAKYPITLKFEDIVYKIKSKKGSKKQGDRVILKGMSGAVLPGELLAMLGPSGSGKTTLLTILGGRGRRRNSHQTGSITYNGRPFSNSLKRNMGFVTQDDVLYAHLTVTETLVYTALLRLPSSLPRAAKVEQAEAVMEQLGLVACRNSIIGGPLLRGISGGERKRVSIGQEMLINPSLIFLDEPTSGLDSTIAGRIVSTLWDLTKGGKTVVMTIHQPSSRLFYMFHKVMLLSDGNPIYFGKGAEAMDYFARIGYAPNVAMNPADFLLDLANGVFSDEVSEDRTSTKEALVSAYRHHLRDQVSEDLSGITKQFKETESDKMAAQWCTTWWQQFRVLLERDLKERRHEAFSGLKLAQVIAVALLAGFLWFGSKGGAPEQVGLIFFVAGFWSFYPVFQAIFTFPQERTLLTKERSSGMYRLSSYFAARMVGDLPMELVLPIIFVSITYWMGGLKPNAASFFANLGVLLLSVLVAQGLGLAVGALIMDLKAATTLASVLMLSFMLTGGYYVQHVPSFIAWIKYISLNYYTFKLQVQAQFAADETYPCSPTARCLVRELPAVKMVGFDYQGVAVVALVLMLVFYRLVAYFGLMRIGATR